MEKKETKKPRVSFKEKLAKALNMSEEFFILVDEPLSVNFVENTSNIQEIADKANQKCISCLTKYAIKENGTNCAARFVEAPFLVIKDKIYYEDDNQWIPGMVNEIYVYKKASLKLLIEEIKDVIEMENYTWLGYQIVYNHYHTEPKSIESIVSKRFGINQEFIEVVEGPINCPMRNLDKSINITHNQFINSKATVIKDSPIVIRANQPSKKGQSIEKVTINKYSNVEDTEYIFNNIVSRISAVNKVAKERLNK